MFLFALWLVALAPQAGEVHPADALLAKAEAQAAKGFYDQARQTYRELLRSHPDSAAATVAERRSRPSGFVASAELVRHGPPANRVDIVLMGDGYTLKHMRAFDALADDVPPIFERHEPFREYYSYLNFHRASLVSADSGVDGFGREYDTALGAVTLPTIAGHVGIDFDLVHEMLDELPEHDELAIVFVKTGVSGTGGAGIAAVGGRGIRLTIHEWGHAFGPLADEYATHTHNRGAPASGINVSISEDPKEAPWGHWLEARVPGIGLYEGACGQVRDAWRPTASGCIMNEGEVFCPVCREALVLRIHSLVDPIDHHYPPTVPVEAGVALLMRDEPLTFEVRTLLPDSHELEVRWWVLKETEAPRRGGSAGDGRYGRAEPTFGDRRDRGPFHDVPVEPVSVSRHDKTGEHRFVLKPNDLEGPGRYRVLCRVRDDARPRGERRPWVLADPHHLLQSERGWWVELRE